MYHFIQQSLIQYLWSIALPILMSLITFTYEINSATAALFVIMCWRHSPLSPLARHHARRTCDNYSHSSLLHSPFWIIHSPFTLSLSPSPSVPSAFSLLLYPFSLLLLHCLSRVIPLCFSSLKGAKTCPSSTKGSGECGTTACRESLILYYFLYWCIWTLRVISNLIPHWPYTTPLLTSHRTIRSISEWIQIHATQVTLDLSDMDYTETFHSETTNEEK